MSISIPTFDAQFLSLRSILVGHAALFVQGDRDRAEDLVQDLYCTARDLLSTYRGPALRPWLIGILNNLSRTQSRRRAHEIAALERLADESVRQPIARGDLYDRTLWRIRIADLTDRQTVALRLRLDGYTLREISSALRLDASTVRQHLRAGISRLQECDPDFLYASGTGYGQRVTIYHAPTTTGAGLARESLRRLAAADGRNAVKCRRGA